MRDPGQFRGPYQSDADLWLVASGAANELIHFTDEAGRSRMTDELLADLREAYLHHHIAACDQAAEEIPGSPVFRMATTPDERLAYAAYFDRMRARPLVLAALKAQLRKYPRPAYAPVDWMLEECTRATNSGQD